MLNDEKEINIELLRELLRKVGNIRYLFIRTSLIIRLIVMTRIRTRMTRVMEMQ